MPDDVQDGTTPEPTAPAPPPPTGTVSNMGPRSLSEVAAASDPDSRSKAVESAPPGDDPSGDDATPDDDDQGTGDPDESPDASDKDEDSGADDDGLEEVEVFGETLRVTPERARVIRAEQKAAKAEARRLEDRMKHLEREAGRAKRQKGKQQTDDSDDDGDGEDEPKGPPKPQLVPMDSVLEAFGRYDKTGKPEDLQAAFDAHKRHILTDPEAAKALAETLGLTAIKELLHDFALDLDRLDGGHKQVAQQVQPEIERQKVLQFARQNPAFKALDDEVIGKAHTEAKTAWETELEELGIQPGTATADKLAQRILTQHLTKAAEQAKPKTPPKGDVSKRQPSKAPGPSAQPVGTSDRSVPVFRSPGLSGIAGR